MGAKLQSTDSDDMVENHEINVTPFIDVILVLLIIFMVAAPLSTVDISVDLPASTAQLQPRPEKPLFVTLKSDLGVAVGEETVGWDRLGSAIDEVTRYKYETRIFIRADKTVPYGDIMRLFNALRVAGYLKVAMVGLEQGQQVPSP